MKKLVTIILLAAMLAIVVLPAAVFAGDPPADPPVEPDPTEFIKIETADEFLAIKGNNAYYLANDIDLSTATGHADGIYTNYVIEEFNGILDGRGHKVYNYTLKQELANDDAARSDMGTILKANGLDSILRIQNITFGTEENPVKIIATEVFGQSIGVVLGANLGDSRVAASLSYTNVTVYGNITSTYTRAKDSVNNIGGFVGVSRSADFKDCVSNVTIDTDALNKLNVSGFIGKIEANTTITIDGCTVNGSIACGKKTGNVAVYQNAAGFIAGGNNSRGGYCLIIDSVNNAEITQYCSKEGRAAGFAAYIQVVDIINCVNNGNVTVLDDGDTKAGAQTAGFVCDAAYEDVRILNSTNKGDITSSTISAGFIANARYTASIIGCVNEGIITGADDTKGDLYSVIADGKKIYTLEGVDKTTATPIETAADFKAITGSGNYYLTKDIDFEDAEIDKIMIADFKGILDGCGHSVYGYKLKGAASGEYNVGTFNDIGEALIVNISFGTSEEHIKVEIPSITNGSVGTVIAAVAKYSMPRLINVKVFSDIKIDSQEGGSHIGGVVGYCRNARFYNCEATVDIDVACKGTPNVGGIVGNIPNWNKVTGKDKDGKDVKAYQEQNAKFFDCTSNGKVVIHPAEGAAFGNWANAGGFVGGDNSRNFGTRFMNCVNNTDCTAGYAAGDVRAAGFLGYSNYFVMKDCVNNGNQTIVDLNETTISVKGNAAGIVGMSDWAPIFMNVTNNGKITGSYLVAGINAFANDTIAVVDCVNNGELVKSADAAKTADMCAEIAVAAAGKAEKVVIVLNSNYTVEWVVNDETVAYKALAFNSEIPAFEGSTDKPSDVQYTYTFDKFDNESSKVTGDMTLTALYTPTLNKYNVTWLIDGQPTVVAFDYGTTPEYTGTPEKAAVGDTQYRFTGWDKVLAPVTGDITYTATFVELGKVSVKWIVNGVIVSTETISTDTVPTAYAGSTDKAADAQYTYTFTGWDKDITAAVTEDTIFTAQYSTTVNSYTIKWVVNGVESTTAVDYGTVPTFVGSTDKAADKQYTYTFKGWDVATVAVVGDATYTAEYNKTVNQYTIKWVVDGKETTAKVAYDTVPTFKGEAKKAADAQYTYTFKSWDVIPVAVVGDATYTAQFTQTVNEYTIKWVVDGNETTAKVAYGTVPAFAGSTDKAADEEYTYTFKGWDVAPVAVVGDATYTAQYDKTAIVAVTTPAPVTESNGCGGCGGLAIAAQLIAVICGGFAFAIIKKK